MGLPVKNYLLLAITSAQIKEQKSRDMSRDHLP